MPTIGQRLRHIIADGFGAAVVEQTLEKAIQDAKDRAAAPQTQFYDPMSLFMGREWLTKQSGSLGFAELRQMANNPIIGSIVQTRIAQVAAFCSPRTDTYDIGYEINSETSRPESDGLTSDEISKWVYNCGHLGYGDNLLETFARKFIRDSLVLDQACAEIVPRRNGLPSYWVAVDSATIRRLRASLEYDRGALDQTPIYAQVVDEVITATYTKDQLIYGIRNPQSDMRLQGYGLSELEMLVRVVTTILNTERYNSGMLTQGGTAKGVLVVRGEVDNDQFNVFKRDFREAIRNASQAWRPPVLRVSKDSEVDWKTLDRSNRDMEYAQLFDFLVKQACGVYQINPEEINWSIGAAGATTTFQSNDNPKFTQSHSKGLKPLLTFLANQLNINLVSKVANGRWRLEFKGLDEDKEKDTDIFVKEVGNIKTLNEVRKNLNLVEVEGGDVILNDLYMKSLEAVRAEKSGMPVPEKSTSPNARRENLPEDEVDIENELRQ